MTDGRTTAQMQRLEQIARALGVPIAHLTKGAAPTPAPVSIDVQRQELVCLFEKIEDPAARRYVIEMARRLAADRSPA